jgi:hypothetical protein
MGRRIRVGDIRGRVSCHADQTEFEAQKYLKILSDFMPLTQDILNNLILELLLRFGFLVEQNTHFVVL